MDTSVVLLGAAMLIGLAVIGSRRSAKVGTDRLPLAEAIWFQATVTWPIAVKSSLGSLIFAGDVDASTTFRLVTYGPASIIAAVIVLQRIRGSKVFVPGMVVSIFPILALPYIAFASEPFTTALAIVLILPIVLGRTEHIGMSAWLAQARLSLLLVATAIAVTALVSRANVIGPCRISKCPIFGEVLVSPLTNNGNFFGVAIAIILPWALMRLAGPPSIALSVAALALIELSGSRSALIGGVLAVGAIFLARLFPRRVEAFSNTALVGAIGASVLTAVVPFRPDFATNRGLLWERARELIGDSPFIGHGPSFWSAQANRFDFVANYSPHNIWLEWGVSGGLVGIAVIAVAWLLLIHFVPTEDRPVYIVATAVLLAVGTLEAPVQVGKLGLAPFAALIPLMIASSGPMSTRTLDDPQIHAGQRGKRSALSNAAL